MNYAKELTKAKASLIHYARQGDLLGVDFRTDSVCLRMLALLIIQVS